MLVKHIGATTASTAGVMAATLVRQVLIYKYLSVSSIGEYALVSTIIIFLQPIITGDIKIFMRSMLPGYATPRAVGYLKTALLFELLMGTLGFLVLAALIHAALPWAKLFPALQNIRLLYWCFPVCVAASLFAHVQRYLASKLYITASAIGELLSAIIYAVLLWYLFVIAKHISVHIVFACWMASSLAGLLGLLIYMAGEFYRAEPASFRIIPAALHFSAPGLVADYGGTIVNYFDRLTIGHYMMAYDLGLYGFIYNVLNISQAAARSVMDSLFSSYFIYAVKNSHSVVAHKILGIYLRWSTLAAMTVLVFFAFYGERFIVLVSHTAMLPSFPYFFILWPLFIFSVISQIKSIHLTYIDEVRSKLVWVNVWVIPLTIITYIIGIKYYHLVGACVASALTALLSYIAMAIYSGDFPVAALYLEFAPQSLATLALTAAVNYAASRSLNQINNNFITVTAGGILCVAFSVLIAQALGFISWKDKDNISMDLKTMMATSPIEV